MLDDEDINPEQYDRAVSQRRCGSSRESCTRASASRTSSASSATQLIAKYGANTVRSGGLKVYTTIVPRYQRAAVKSIRDTLY